jgi:serine/threonine protein kinase
MTPPVTASQVGEALPRRGDESTSRAWRLRDEPGIQSSFPPGSCNSALMPGSAFESGRSRAFLTVLEEFTLAWDRGQAPFVEEYLARLDPADSRGAVELIYREFCLAEAAGLLPERSLYLARFPRHVEALDRLLALHAACTPSLLGRWVESACGQEDLPKAGDVIGPYILRRELGRGSFARVFLAEEADLENRLVVVKVASRPTREPWLLARARHANIVEIVSHAPVNEGALQLICMPFWGGATLTAVLAARQRRERHPVDGRDLLADLDAVAAPEYPAVHPARPAREILAGLSYDQAWAWIGARLAEALDHAFSRDVAHGDVKPSNVLLSADGNPMLLDFNLARDGSPARSDGSVNDLGGTLAYMAPERLRALAADDPDDHDSDPDRSQAGVESDRDARAGSSRSPDAPDRGPHLADMYALGMVLLEALTGQPPANVVIPAARAPQARPRGLKVAASVYAAGRARSAGLLIRDSEAAGGRAITPGLRAILERCLDPDPARRYRRAWELAEDLDRWRTNRPLCFTSEPFWGQTIPRWLRQQRRKLIFTAAALSVLVGLPTTAVVMLKSRTSLQNSAQFKLARHWDDPEAYRFQRSSSDWLEDSRQALASLSSTEPSNPHASQTALRALLDYGVLDPDDWRRRDDVRALPAADREDLELWLLEQAYRFCRALDDRPNSPDDWRRARKILDRLGARAPLASFTELSRRLSVKLGDLAPADLMAPAGSRARSDLPAGSVAPPLSPELDLYLLGVAAECDLDSQLDDEPEAALGSPRQSPAIEPVSSGLRLHARQRGAERALDHYRTLLALRPHSYWGHYRAAATSYLLGSFDETALHLEHCLKRRPENATLRAHWAACLAWLERFPEALQECNEAVAGAPDVAESYRTRAFIRAASGQKNGLAEDIQHYELLSHILPRALWSSVPATGDSEARHSPGTATQRVFELPAALDFETRLGHQSPLLEGSGRDVEADAEEINARVVLASTIRKAGESEVASAEYAKILILDPDHIPSRMTRAMEAIESQRFGEARRDLEAILNHPGLISHLRKDPTFIRCLHRASGWFALSGHLEEGRALARRALDLALILKQHRGECHYYLARAYAISARTDPQFMAEAANQLYRALVANPEYRERYYEVDSLFDPVRVQIDAALRDRPDPAEAYRRQLATPLARAR